MCYTETVKRAAVLIAILLFAVSGLSAFSWVDWSLDIGFQVVVNSTIGTGTDNKEAAGFFFVPGASVHGDFDGEYGGGYFRPGGWFSWSLEEVYYGIVRPCDAAESSHMKVLGLMMDAPFGYVWRTGKVDVGLQGGPSIYARFPLYTAENGDGEPVDFWKAYYSRAQLLYLNMASWVSIPLSGSEGDYSGTDLVIGLRAYYPLSNIWTNAPFFHTTQIGLTASLQIGMKETAKNAAAEKDTAQ